MLEILRLAKTEKKSNRQTIILEVKVESNNNRVFYSFTWLTADPAIKEGS
jgi:hypothetical protein